jgi:hypothetical protein
VKYETAGAGGLTIALEVANDAGVGSLYNPEANVGIQFISNLIQRQRGKFFDFRDVNSWEVTVIKSLPGSMLYLAAGERPFLNDVDGVNSPKKDSRYIVARFDAKLGEYSIDVGGNLEKVNSKVLGEVTVHTVESGVARSFGKTQVGARALYRMGHVPREQFTALYLGANRAIFDFGDVTVGGAVRGSAHRLNAPDSKWNLGAEVGAAIFNNPASSLDQIKSRNDAAENAKRLRAEKKNEKKAKNK